MNGIIICTHGNAGFEMLKSVEMIMGPQDNIAAVKFLNQDSPDYIMEQYKEKMRELKDCNNILFLVDLKGGTPFNVALRYTLENSNSMVLSGLNIPMLISICMNKDDYDIEKLAECATQNAIEGIDCIGSSNK